MTNLVDYIRPDCSITLLNEQTLLPHDIENCKKYYKKEIFEKFQGNTVGKVALIWTNDLPVILPALKAIWELGMVVVAHDFNLNVVNHPAFKNFYNHINLVIGPASGISCIDQVLPDVAHVYQLEQSKGYVFPFDESQLNFELNGKITPDTICCITHTSGTTGEPKIIKITHRTAIDLVHENIRLFDFSCYDRVLHHKTLHHGALFLNYAIPAFFSTNQHFWISSGIFNDFEGRLNFLKEASLKCQANKITKWMLPYNWINDLGSAEINSYDLSSTELITVIGPNQSEITKIFAKQNPKSIYNNFGCTEIGTLAISKTQIDNIADYAPNKFTKLNRIVNLEIFPTFFKVKFKIDQQWRTIGDIIKIKNDTLIWEGRNTVILFDQLPVKVSSIEQWLRTYLKTSAFSLVPDFETNQLYLAVYENSLVDLTLDVINQALQSEVQFKNCFFSKISNIEFKKVLQGMKPSQPVLLYYFRNQSD